MHMIFIGFPKLKTTFLWSGTMQTSQMDIEDDFKMDCDAYRASKDLFFCFHCIISFSIFPQQQHATHRIFQHLLQVYVQINRLLLMFSLSF